MAEVNSIEVKNVSLVFKSRKGFFRHTSHPALKDVSFEIKRGETFGVIGHNGSGKSSLLKVLSGIFSPDKGRVIHHDRYITLQTLSAGFDNQLSGRDNAIISSMFLGKTKQQALNELDSIKDFSEIGDAFEEPVKTYSSGMRARLGFSVAITIDADVLLVDEVLGVGDTQFRRKAEAAIMDKIDSNQTVVFVSHSADQVKRLCERVVWLERGKLVKLGPAQEVVDEYELFMQQVKK